MCFSWKGPVEIVRPTQRTRGAGPMLLWYWFTVGGGEPTLKQHRVIRVAYRAGWSMRPAVKRTAITHHPITCSSGTFCLFAWRTASASDSIWQTWRRTIHTLQTGWRGWVGGLTSRYSDCKKQRILVKANASVNTSIRVHVSSLIIK